MSKKNTLTIRLNEHRLRKQFINHDFFRRVKVEPLSRQQVAVFIGQWWHPLHYFPTFLARAVSVLPDIASKSAVSKILNQETGEGNPARAHEVVYIDSMKRAGFTRDETTAAPPFPETQRLVEGYERASAERFAALGFIFATEVADLTMVSGIGTAVERATGVRDLEWVNIHVEQEPDHVEEADNTLLSSFKAREEGLVLDNAERMWELWTGFFDRLEREVFGQLPYEAAQEGERGALSA
jgi:pyrroloquinoline quinone (PQQ) biosynthesis protein C